MTPVYPYLTAVVFKVLGIYTATSALVLLSLQSLISALTCLPVFHLALKPFGQKVAVWSGWAWVLFPCAVYFPAERIWSTWLSTALLAVLFLSTLHLKHSRLARWIGAGLLLGIAALTDPIVLAAWPFMNGWICERMHRQKQRWAVAFGRFIPFRDNAGLEIHIGNSGDTFH